MHGPSSGDPDDYVLGRSVGETQRLIVQHQLYGPLTRQFLSGAGITAGMKVLDVGSGAGDVALLLADLVGPQGEVVGVDLNAEILDTARSRVRMAGWTNVSFRQGAFQDLGLDSDFDAVVGRWVLMYVPDPVDLLRAASSQLRPGGIVAFQEGDIKTSVRQYPSSALHDQLLRWTTPPPGEPGPDSEMGVKLFRTFLHAGLPAPQLRFGAPIGGGAGWPGYAYLTETLRSLLPFLTRAGLVTSAEVDIDTLEERLRADAVSRDAIQILPPLVGAWAPNLTR